MGEPAADFDSFSWHDNHIYGLRFVVGDAARGDWRSELVLDIDHIVAWEPGADGTMRFRVAPATMIFYDVTDLALALHWGDSGYQTALNEASIDRIERMRVTAAKVCLGRPYYRWRILTNLPHDGEIAFGASAFSQRLRAEPLLCDEQKLVPSVRPVVDGS